MNTINLPFSFSTPDHSGDIRGSIQAPECLWPIGLELRFDVGEDVGEPFFVTITGYDVHTQMTPREVKTTLTIIFGKVNERGSSDYHKLRQWLEPTIGQFQMEIDFTPIEDLKLIPRAENALLNAGFKTVGSFRGKTLAEIKIHRGLRYKRVTRHIYEKLLERGVDLKWYSPK